MTMVDGFLDQLVLLAVEELLGVSSPRWLVSPIVQEKEASSFRGLFPGVKLSSFMSVMVTPSWNLLRLVGNIKVSMSI